MSSSSDQSIQRAVDEVRRLITDAVRQEQFRDQLTELFNDAALMENLQQMVEAGQKFWCAFFEIDRFKEVNDKFGYSQADALLKRVAVTMSTLASNSFGNAASVYRAHGDEFYVLVPVENDISSDKVQATLDSIRLSIAQISINVDKQPEPMSCTVSVGWVTSDAARLGGTSPQPTSPQGIKYLLEHATSYAKRKGRNRVVLYDAETVKAVSRSVRTSCNVCETSFSADIPVEREEAEKSLFCPNCGTELARPAPPSKPPDDTVI
ncbi:GGDEF domain-containing protein [Myxococcota bacterium]|jgi:diguanylate cyclase (GGDEF)-like protein|nr:GGDEF domain-containing protein [Myxococcota bacterium]